MRVVRIDDCQMVIRSWKRFQCCVATWEHGLMINDAIAELACGPVRAPRYVVAASLNVALIHINIVGALGAA